MHEDGETAMRVVTDFRDIPPDLKGAVVALGNFDGVHRGHIAVLRQGQEIARELGAPTGVLTFELAGMRAEDFVERIIVEAWQARHVIVGYNFFFGKGRGGSPQLLRELGADKGFGVTVIEPASDDGEVFSSSSARDLLRVGNVRAAAEILGHWWTVSGSVEHGAGRGTGMGYPTVNVMLEPGQALHHGIYAARVWVDGHRFDGAAYNGRRPTFDNGIAKLEVFLFDFNDSLYGHRIDVELIDFIRSDEAFESAEALVAQMDKDCARAREILAEINSADPMLQFPIGKAIAASITTARA
jgi:riboflavin kinase/FMN adenylyltransferase